MTFKTFIHALQEKVRRPVYRNFLANLLSFFLPRKKIVGYESEIRKLHNENFLEIKTIINESEINELFQHCMDSDLSDRWRPDFGLFKLTNKPSETHVANISTLDLLKCNSVLRIANDKDVLSIVTKYFGCVPIIDSIDSWWSFSGFKESENEQFFHRDNDSLKFVKLFIYLTDVGDCNGPHVLCKSSRNISKFLKARKRYSDEDVFKHFSELNIKTFTGKAGTTFIEDTYSLHKGMLPKKGKRLLFQVRYSIYPSVFSKKLSVYTKSELKDMGFDCYTNKLFLKG